MEKIDPTFLKRIESEENYTDIIKSGEPFKDENFLPDSSSLFNPNFTKLSSGEMKTWKKFTWKRAPEHFKGEEFSVFHGIEPNDIKQGNLGNCYFLSALSSMAEFPQRIKDIFPIHKVNSAGCYPMNLCVNGQFIIIIVDDYFPYDPLNEVPAFSKANENELWVLLLEKAWAKVNGTYENTIQGLSSEALRFLTGAPCAAVNHDSIDDEALYTMIKQADDRNYIICASAGKGSLSKEEYSSIGLISDHSYAVIQAKEISTSKGMEKLLQLRNPWGHLEWKGDWSDKSPLWTTELKKQLNFVDEDDGTFFMNFEDYLTYYRSTVICKVHDNYIFNAEPGFHKQGGYSLHKIKVTRPTKGFVTFSQIQQRIMSIKYQNYEISEVNLIFAKLKSSGKREFEFLEGISGKEEDLSIEFPHQLEIGEYIIYSESDWLFGGLEHFTINTYTDHSVIIEDVDIAKYPDFLPSVLKSCALKKTKPKDYGNKGEPDILKYMSINDSKANFGYALYKNKSTDSCLFETCKFSKLEGCKLLPPHGGMEYKVNVGPQEEQIVLIKKTKGIASYSSSFSSGIKKSEHILMQQIDKGNAKVIQFKMGTEVYDIFLYTISHDFGYVLVFRNKTPNSICDASFDFDLENLAFEDCGSKWDLQLKPGEEIVKKLNIVNMNEGATYKYKYSYRCKDYVVDDKSIIQKLLTKGTKKKIIYKDTPLNIAYYVQFIDDAYYWYFDNGSDKIFKGKFKFDLTNLSMEERGEDTWTITLHPGEQMLKKLSIDDISQQSSYKVQMSYTLEHVEQ